MEEENKLFVPDQNYELPKLQEVVLDSQKGELVDEKSLTVYQKIKLIADKLGFKMKEPNKSCTKSGCYGRGYVGTDLQGVPIPCSCVFEKQTVEDEQKQAPRTINRNQRRQMEKTFRKRLQAMKKGKANGQGA